MSLITYNDITLPYPETIQFSQEAVDDDNGHTDWCLTKFDIKVQCLLNANYMSVIAPQFSQYNPTNAAAVMKQIRTSLLARRKQLSFICNGVELIPARAGVSGYVDAKNGPVPVSCEVISLTDTAFLMNYHIVAHYWENYTTGGVTGSTSTNKAGNPVVFNRWSETIDLDHLDMSRRVREGMYRIRSDNVDGSTADMLRSKMAVVGVPQGFTRESSSYSISEDGLTIKYRITDKEAYKMPPVPAFKATGEYSETDTLNGAVRWGECRVKLEGSRFIDQAQLVELVLTLCSIKLNIAGAKKEGKGFAKGFANGFALPGAYTTIRVGMWENWVECCMRARIVGARNRIGGIAGFSGLDGFSANMVFVPFSSDATVRPIYRNRGTAGLLLQAARYYDPNLRDNQLGETNVFTDDNDLTFTDVNQMSRGRDIGKAGKNPE